MREREPICGFCWAGRREQEPLIFLPRKGYWVCPHCHMKAICPRDQDEEEIRRDLAIRYATTPGAVSLSASEGMLRSMREHGKGGGGKSGVVGKELMLNGRSWHEDADLIRKHNARMRRQNR